MDESAIKMLVLQAVNIEKRFQEMERKQLQQQQQCLLLESGEQRRDSITSSGSSDCCEIGGLSREICRSIIRAYVGHLDRQPTKRLGAS